MTSDAVWITEAEVVAAVDLRVAIGAVRAVLGRQDDGSADALEKTATAWGDGHTLHALGGVDGRAGLVGTKTWAHSTGGATPLLVLWDAEHGGLRAVVEAFALGQLRTASISAVATDVLAPAGARCMAMIGTGRQALAQVAAVVSQRAIEEVRVFSPTAEHRAALVAAVTAQAPGVHAVDSASVAAAVDGADVVTTATRATDAILGAGDLGASVHINAVGAITPERRELAPSVVATADLVVSDVPAAALQLSAELDGVEEVVPLARVVAAGEERPDGLTLFKAMGLGLADVAVGGAVLSAVLERGGGRPIPAPTRSAPVLFSAVEQGGRP
jgi:ornithine cyclodeaminase